MITCLDDMTKFHDRAIRNADIQENAEEKRLEKMDCHNCQSCYDVYADWCEELKSTDIFYCEQKEHLQTSICALDCDSFIEFWSN